MGFSGLCSCGFLCVCVGKLCLCFVWALCVWVSFVVWCCVCGGGPCGFVVFRWCGVFRVGLFVGLVGFLVCRSCGFRGVFS